MKSYFKSFLRKNDGEIIVTLRELLKHDKDRQPLTKSSATALSDDVNLNEDSSSDTLFAGTFDRLHIGHLFVISSTWLACLGDGNCHIAITTDGKMTVNKNYAKDIESFGKRLGRLELLFNLLSLTDPIDSKVRPQVDLVPLNDGIGIAAEPRFSGKTIFCTSDTAKGTEKVNEYRKSKGLSDMKIVALPEVEHSNGAKISSTHLREQYQRKTFVGS